VCGPTSLGLGIQTAARPSQRPARHHYTPVLLASGRGGGTEFQVLGPLQVRDQGQPTPLTAAMSHTLLGILLCRANSPVSVDAL